MAIREMGGGTERERENGRDRRVSEGRGKVEKGGRKEE